MPDSSLSLIRAACPSPWRPHWLSSASCGRLWPLWLDCPSCCSTSYPAQNPHLELPLGVPDLGPVLVDAPLKPWYPCACSSRCGGTSLGRSSSVACKPCGVNDHGLLVLARGRNMSLRRQRSRQLVKGHRGVLERLVLVVVLVILAVMADVIVHGVRKRRREKGASEHME